MNECSLEVFRYSACSQCTDTGRRSAAHACGIAEKFPAVKIQRRVRQSAPCFWTANRSQASLQKIILESSCRMYRTEELVSRARMESPAISRCSSRPGVSMIMMSFPYEIQDVGDESPRGVRTIPA